MFSKFIILLGLLFGLAISASAQDAKAQALTPTAQPSPVVTATAPAGEGWTLQPKLSVGIGYPDLRVRGQIWGNLDGELKFAFDSQTQAYSARLYYSFWRWQRLDFDAGVEGGYLAFAGIDRLTGNGFFFEGFAGARLALAPSFGLTAEFGPAYITVSADDESADTVSWIATTAIYFHIF